MATCRLCNRTSRLISRALRVCGDCLIHNPDRAASIAAVAHARSRARFQLPGELPRSADKGTAGGKFRCPICGNECALTEGQRGFCGLRLALDRKFKHLAGTPRRGLVSWYYDPLPTNCVASWVCPGGTGAGYPTYAYSEGPEYGYNNLAVFYEACSFDCLFCQNWHFRSVDPSLPANWHSADELAASVRRNTSCLCFFGGDPGPQIPHALRAAQLVVQQNPGRILRICWETNGNMSPKFLKHAVDLSLHTGGCIKFDLKAYTESLHVGLTGVSNKKTLANFADVAGRISERPEPPLLVASTLLIPGYVGQDQVRAIARFIASLSPDIPYSLLAFHPDFEMTDLPTTSRQLAEACLQAAREEGLRRVHLGNTHLLWDEAVD